MFYLDNIYINVNNKQYKGIGLYLSNDLLIVIYKIDEFDIKHVNINELIEIIKNEKS